jgi:hypothetical protein
MLTADRSKLVHTPAIDDVVYALGRYGFDVKWDDGLRVCGVNHMPHAAIASTTTCRHRSMHCKRGGGSPNVTKPTHTA